MKCLCFYHPDDAAALKLRQRNEMLREAAAARGTRHELLLEINTDKHGVLALDTEASVLIRLYEIGPPPGWRKLEPQRRPYAWRVFGVTTRARDPFCRGMLVLELDAPESELARSFVVGRTIFGEPVQAWFAVRITNEQAKQQMVNWFASLVEVWHAACGDTATSEEART
jgi:5-dehydro-2-deoxygluconokinase